ncbi:MAG: ribonuclease HII [Alphaproteobacteria bacterium]|nr:ribonuclease HII [Alphaproteobacteria bacterium]
MTLQWFHNNNININSTIGIDEVGRGPLAGPVVSAAVWISEELAKTLESQSKSMSVRDSKKLSHKQRQKLLEWIGKQSADSIKYGIGVASVQEIDEVNILQATMLSMKRACNNLKQLWASKNEIQLILIDGNAAPSFSDFSANIKTVVKGDSLVLSISLASIIAKEYRDAIMFDLAKSFPQYGWQTNVGYGTKAHLDAIKDFGITQYHRKSFAPVRDSVNLK